MRHQARIPLPFFQKISRKSYENEIDEFFSNIDLIRGFGGINAIKTYKVFVKKYRYLCGMNILIIVS